MGELLLREEDMHNSMCQSGNFYGNGRDGKGPVSVPYQKRVDLMMEREREKQERLENIR